MKESKKLDVLRVELKAENGLNPSSWEEEIDYLEKIKSSYCIIESHN